MLALVVLLHIVEKRSLPKHEVHSPNRVLQRVHSTPHYPRPSLLLRELDGDPLLEKRSVEQSRQASLELIGTVELRVLHITVLSRTRLHNRIATVMRHHDVGDVVIHGIAVGGGSGVLLRCEEVVAASDEAQHLAARTALDEETAHGGRQIATAMQADNPVTRLDTLSLRQRVNGGGEEKRFQLLGLHLLRDVIGDHSEVRLALVLLVHLRH